MPFCSINVSVHMHIINNGNSIFKFRLDLQVLDTIEINKYFLDLIESYESKTKRNESKSVTFYTLMLFISHTYKRERRKESTKGNAS